MEKVYSGYELEVNKNVEDIAYNGRMLKIEGNSKQKIIEEVKGKEVTGEFITVNDVELEDGRIAVSGNSKQETSVQGKNMLDVAIFDEGTHNGITLTRTKGTNKVTLNGTTTTNFTIHSNDLDISQFEVGKTYTLSISTDKCKYSFEVFENDSSSASIWSNSITMQSTYTRIRTYLQQNSAVTFDNEEIALQFEAGEATEIEDFTPDMPSPDYPSEVESCGDNINLFDKDNANKIQDTFIGITGSVGTATANQIVYVECKKNATITVQKKVSTRFRVATYSSTDIVGKTLSNVKVNDAGTSITITSGEKDTYLFVQYIGPDDKDNSATILKTLKIAYSSKETGYSEYGQGCINEVICNKNIFNKNDVVEDYFVSSSIVSNSSWCYNLSQCFKTGKKYTTSGGRCILSYFNGDTNISYQDITNGIITIPENTTKVYISTLKTNLNILQIEEGSTATPYVEHKSQTYTIPTQQPFRANGDTRDTFIKKNNKWYERHYIARKIFDGTENITIVNTNTENWFYNFNTNNPAIEVPLPLCSHYKSDFVYTSNTNKGIFITVNGNIRIREEKEKTVNDFKVWLTMQYNAGTPVYVDYILATPLDIECTEEQSAVLEKLHNATIYIPETNVYNTDEIAPNATLKYDFTLPSPSVEVPSEIECCGDNINLFDGNFRQGNAGNITDIKNVFSNNNILLKKGNYSFSTNLPTTFKWAIFGSTQEFPSSNTVSFNSSFKTLPTYNFSFTDDYYLGMMIAKVDGSEIIPNELRNYYFKIEKGSTATPYSPYGQGSANVKICNKNIEDNEFEIGGIDSTTGELRVDAWILRNKNFIKIKPNQKYIMRAVEYSGIKIINTGCRYYDRNKKYLGNYHVSGLEYGKKEFTITDENVAFCKFIHLNSEAIPSDYTLKIQLEEDTETDYVEHEEQNYPVDMQQPFRAIGDIRDTFIKKNNKWYERHKIKRKIFDGTEEIGILWNTGKYGYYIKISDMKMTSSASDKSMILSNMYKVYTQDDLFNLKYPANGIACRANKNEIIIRDDNITTLSDLITNLSTNKPYVDYILTTPLDIECTPEQEIKLEKIQNIKLYDGINYIYSLDDIEALLTFEYYYKMKDYDFYLSADGYLNIPSLGIRYLVDLNESSISTMPEAVESSVRVAGRDGDVVLNTTYEPIPFNIVCYTEDNLTAMEKTEQEIKINSFLNSIKNRTKRFAIERNTKFYEVKYNGALTTINFPKFLKFSIPFKSSDSYGKDIVENIMIGNEKVNSNTIKEVGALITIKGPAISPIIALNDYSIEYSTDIIDGARIEIDTNKSTVTHINSDEVKTNVMKYYNHQFPKIENGENELKILSGIDDNNRVNIKWNDLKL